MSEEIFCYAYTIFALEHVDQHVDEDVEVRVELDGVHKIARDVAHHVVQSGVRSAEATLFTLRLLQNIRNTPLLP